MLVLVFLAVVAVIAMLARGASGGPLDPPGAPGPTDSVRLPGTPINALPFVTSGPGHYYLTRDLTSTGSNTGVLIQHGEVTLDLMGFTLRGNAGTGTGVLVNGSFLRSISIRNGTITGFFDGINAFNAVYSQISDVAVLVNGAVIDDGSVAVRIGAHSVIDNCNVSGNTGTGIVASHVTIQDCFVSDNGGSGIYTPSGHLLVHDNYLRNNDLDGDASESDIRTEGSASLLSDNRFTRPELYGTNDAGLRNALCFVTLGNDSVFFPLETTPEGNVFMVIC